jgi:hypothetical protein
LHREFVQIRSPRDTIHHIFAPNLRRISMHLRCEIVPSALEDEPTSYTSNRMRSIDAFIPDAFFLRDYYLYPWFSSSKCPSRSLFRKTLNSIP